MSSIREFEDALWAEALTSTMIHFDGTAISIKCTQWPHLGILRVPASKLDAACFQECLAALENALETNGIDPWAHCR